jgi:hypothetical protein
VEKKTELPACLPLRLSSALMQNSPRLEKLVQNRALSRLSRAQFHKSVS